MYVGAVHRYICQRQLYVLGQLVVVVVTVMREKGGGVNKAR